MWRPQNIEPTASTFGQKRIIRCEGRLENSKIQLDAKKPILLPTKYHLTDLIIREKHANVQRSGIKITLNCIQERYWILRGREVVKQVRRKTVSFDENSTLIPPSER